MQPEARQYGVDYPHRRCEDFPDSSTSRRQDGDWRILQSFGTSVVEIILCFQYTYKICLVGDILGSTATGERTLQLSNETMEPVAETLVFSADDLVVATVMIALPYKTLIREA